MHHFIGVTHNDIINHVYIYIMSKYDFPWKLETDILKHICYLEIWCIYTITHCNDVHKKEFIQSFILGYASLIVPPMQCEFAFFFLKNPNLINRVKYEIFLCQEEIVCTMYTQSYMCEYKIINIFLSFYRFSLSIFKHFSSLLSHSGGWMILWVVGSVSLGFRRLCKILRDCAKGILVSFLQCSA